VSRARKILKRSGYGIAGLLLSLVIANIVAPVPVEVPYARVVTARDGSVLYTSIASDGQWRMNTRPGEISPELKKAIIYKEDRLFYYHFGINPLAIVRAFGNNVLHRRRTSGASTITMQLARLLEPRPRTYLNKTIEIFRAMQLEMHYSKDAILRMYLNMVPYGSNVQGVKAASILYLNKMPDHLSLAEITALSIIPNRPNSLVPGRNNDRIAVERDKWLHRFQRAHLFPDDVINDALHEPVTAYRHNAPHGAPQFVQRLQATSKNGEELRTSISSKIQLKAEGILRNYINQLKLQNINNASAIVVDNKTHEVIAYVGSSDFSDSAHAGQVDGVHALRSPGSTLKPLLYGLCIDKGIVTPKTVIADVPVNIKGYSPENYDREFRGNVTIENALSHSLNIPAVKLLEANGLDNFLNALTGSGFQSIAESRKNIGMSVILGGCGVRLDELTALYASFANNGRYHPLLFYPASANKTRTTGKDTAVLSPEACYMLTNILSQLQRPDLPNAYQSARNVPHIAWKTGTSYGRKDAWSIGYNQQYTIGVWVGNFNADGVQELSGIATATPLLFQLFNAIDYNAANDWLQPPQGIAFRLVCAETGKVPNDFCTNQVMDNYIPGVSTNEKCDHMRQLWLSPDEQVCYCSLCLPPNGYKTKMVQNISPELATYYDAVRMEYPKTPPHNPACTHSFDGKAPLITSLTNGMTYIVENKEAQKLQLSCAAANDVHKVYWYINDKFFATADAGSKLFFNATSAQMKISCSDDKGRNTDIRIQIQFI
jgi:penicillin-binding protein 1C